ncbi:MAG: 2-iminoacetate synthase ThiH [Phycisphaerae bacterium]|nr:2-iminoacetate synthase ThiH [Phycisphaerae bacterium]MDD5381927.1 2-iminoacetate synthase ThiH [Phycisphaerae bacterium]
MKYPSEINNSDIERAMNSPAGSYSPEKLAALISPTAEGYLEEMAQMARQLTMQRFGKTVRLYAPLYLSNYCVNNCVYCGFNKENKYERRRLTIEQAVKEADIIASEGFRDILLVSSEDREFISVDYLCELAGRLRGKFSSISIEVYQMTTEEYAKLFAAGIEGVTLYQETYDRDVYRQYHPAGPKADYDYRLSAPDSIAQAGMREIGIGALLGLSDWRLETLALGEHAHYLMKRYWKSRVSFSFPRLRPAKNVDRAQFRFLSDKNLVQMIIALRLCFADAGMVLSTRERAELRDHLIEVGITKVSAGSKTSPGGYSQPRNAAEQFEIDDARSPAEVAEMIRAHGFEPVWKDWDIAFVKR